MFDLRRSWPVRLLLAFACTVLVGAQGWVHVCPMHASTTGEHNASSGTDHSSHGAHNSSHANTQQQNSEHHDCNCLGDCTFAVSASAANPPAPNVPAPLAVKNDRPRVARDLPAQTDVAYRLPFANAPPAIA